MSNRPIIKNYRHGYVGHDGNGMVGGSWWGCERLWFIDVCVCDLIDMFDEDKCEEVCRWLEGQGYDLIRVEAYLEEGEDKSTGYSGREIDEVFYPSEFDGWVSSCPLLSEDEKATVIKRFNDYLDTLTVWDFDAYPVDYDFLDY